MNHSKTAAAFLTVALLAGPWMLGQGRKANNADVQLQAAIHTEMVDGNLKLAIEQYKKVALGSNRAVAAQALIRMAQCYQQLGDSESRRIYERVVKEFADQKEAVTTARARLNLAGLREALTTRRVWTARDGMTNLRLGGPSPDGQFLAYASHFTTGDLAVRELSSGVARSVTNNASFERADYASVSRFSLDGKRIAYGWSSGKGYQLRVIDFDGSNEKTVYSNPEVSWIGPVGFSQDGREVLANLQTRSHTGQLAWISLANGTARVLKTLPWASLGNVTLSPNGRYIAYDFATEHSPHRNILLLSSDGSKEVALTDGSAKDEAFAWMPDGKWLLFGTDRTGTQELWALPVDDGKVNGAPVPVKADVGRIEPLGTTANGSLFYSIFNSKGSVSVAAVDWEGGEVKPLKALAQRAVADFGADFSPDGKWLAYVAHRGTQLSERFIAVHNLETGNIREVVPKPNLQIWVTGGNKWSPNGKSFLVTGSDDTHGPGAYAIDMTSGTVRPLINRGSNRVQSPNWLPGGKSIIYCSGGHIYVRDLETGVDREIITGFEHARNVFFALSPDGRQIAFSPLMADLRSGALYVMPLDGGGVRKLLEAPQPELIFAEGWTPDSRRILFKRYVGPGSSTPPSLWWIAPEASEAHRLADHKKGGTAFHPDGKRVAFIETSREVEVWVMENLIGALGTSK